MSITTTRIFVARLAGIGVFDPLGDRVGRVHDVVVLLRVRQSPRAVGLVVEVPGKRRVFLPLSRVTAIDPGAVITSGLLNLRRFQRRAAETLVMGQLLDRVVALRADGGEVTIQDVGLEQQRNRDWLVTKLFVRHGSRSVFGRGHTSVIDVDDVTGLAPSEAQQGAAALLATMDDLKPADLADVVHDLPERRRIEVAAALPDGRLADVLEELGDDDRVAILSALAAQRAAQVLDEMQPDDAADLIAELPTDKASELLDLMEPDEAEDVRRLLTYDDDTAGGLMTTEPIVLGPETSVATALAHARRQDVTPALAAMIFVTRPPQETPTGRLLGVIHLQRMLREPPHEAIGGLLDKDIEAVTADAPIGRITRLLATYNLTALPVVDEQRRLLGAVSVDDLLDHLLPEDWREADDEVTDAAMGGTGG
ncbi:CBS domain-containing protein [Ruania suaedae]|uniref:magnesium transporter MgtE N-terminal domain-containing protein n=1 Tax=Ruania suaedae TaxID=2897774 RepID=UPI001E4699DE|nr:CBS domain-containing protein [Ruania suaedae]UFU03939.1 CBS domain-containing protein [Ruania suaedae]